MMAYIVMSFFFSRSDPRWPTGGHFSCKKPDVEQVLNNFSDIHLPMLFKFSKQIKNGASKVHVALFRDQIQNGLLAAILLLERVINHFSNMHGPILFKLGKITVHNDIYQYPTSFCDLIKGGQLVNWRPLSLSKTQF